MAAGLHIRDVLIFVGDSPILAAQPESRIEDSTFILGPYVPRLLRRRRLRRLAPLAGDLDAARQALRWSRAHRGRRAATAMIHQGPRL